LPKPPKWNPLDSFDFNKDKGENPFEGKQFYCWDTEFLGKRDCCFNHMVGLPVNNETRKPCPLFDYERDILYAWERNRHIWIKKATGLGITELFLRLMLWLALRDKQFANTQFCIVVGPNYELAGRLLGRLKTILGNKYRYLIQRETEYICDINDVNIQGYPSNHLASYRSLPNPKFILVDEGDFFEKGEPEEVRHVSERYIAKSDPWIVLVSTPNEPNGLFDRIEHEEPCLYYRMHLPYTLGINKVYTEKGIEKAKTSPSFEREYNLQYGYGIGNVFFPDDIEKCMNYKYNPEYINDYADHCMGVDPGFGSSKFAICVAKREDDMIKIVHAKEYEKANYEDMKDECFKLRTKYNVVATYIDGANHQFIESFKNAIGESPNFEDVIERCRKNKVDYELVMQIIPVNFSQETINMLFGCQELVNKGYVAIDRRFKELIAQMRIAQHMDGRLIKDKQGNTLDMFDAFRLALRNFYLPRI
jgi:hypothetical protein